MMKGGAIRNFSQCQLGDVRLNRRALEIAKALFGQYGQPLSQVFSEKKQLKRAYEFFANGKTELKKLAQNHWKETAKTIPGLKTVLAVGDTTYLDYKKIIEKREEYRPIGNG
ncbi:MAG: transposase DNA-binding-containing protein, partial [Cyanobacteriota bacterium]